MRVRAVIMSVLFVVTMSGLAYVRAGDDARKKCVALQKQCTGLVGGDPTTTCRSNEAGSCGGATASGCSTDGNPGQACEFTSIESEQGCDATGNVQCGKKVTWKCRLDTATGDCVMDENQGMVETNDDCTVKQCNLSA
jgi:hypothetical protein